MSKLATILANQPDPATFKLTHEEYLQYWESLRPYKGQSAQSRFECSKKMDILYKYKPEGFEPLYHGYKVYCTNIFGMEGQFIAKPSEVEGITGVYRPKGCKDAEEKS